MNADKMNENKMQAVIEAVRMADRWMGGALVVVDANGEYTAIPAAYLTDASYTGSREVVIDLANGLEDATGYSLDDASADEIAELLLDGLMINTEVFEVSVPKECFEGVVVEDNGGGLALYVFVDENHEICIWAHTGYEYVPGQLSQDIKALSNGDYPPEDWDGGVDNPQAVWEETADLLDKAWRNNIDYCHIVATIDATGEVKLFPDRMGVAAKLEFGIKD